MRTRYVALGLLLAFTLSAQAFGQSTFATVSGTVSDPSNAVLPGVSLTATNNATGVVSTVISNESGAYNLTSLLPGVYTVSAELPGFRKETYTDVTLGNAQQVRLNFTLQVATGAQSVEVTVAADTLLATSSSSVGEVLSQQKVEDLPIVANNLLSFYTLMPGVRMNDDGISGTFAGLTADKVNILRDGVDASGSARYSQAGAQTATVINPDLVGEMRIITAPVDAEMGRGNGQIQFLTRSGTNQFRGAGVWSARNTALDANTWTNNMQVDPRTGAWKPTPPSWANNHQLTGSIGGPLVKNKTFFFTLFDDQIVAARTTQDPLVLTPCARNGIFRYFDGWNNGNAITPTLATGSTPTIAVVNGTGAPVTPATNPNGTPFTGALRYASVFGKLLNTPAQPDCSDAVVQAGSNWDPFRKAIDPSGYVAKLMGTMPMPNNYIVGDGLNLAGYNWLRNENHGTESVFGTPAVSLQAGGLARKQINTKIDHNFNSSNKIGVSYTYEDSAGNSSYATWPNGFQGSVFKHPQTLAFNFVSTLSPTLVNEARIGMRRIGENTYNPLNDPIGGSKAQAFVPGYNGYPVLPALGAGTAGFSFASNQIIGGGSTSSYLDTTVLWTYGDSLSWTKGKHSFKFGGEIPRGHSLGNDAGVGNPTTIPRANGGDATNAPISTTAISTANMPGLAGTSASGNNVAMRNLLDFLSGSLANLTQLKFMENPTKLTAYEDYSTFPWRTRDFHVNEGSVFLKDDWKTTKNLTLNLGLRWDYFGVPYDTHGLMAGAVGGEAAIWGVSGSSFSDWMKPGIRGTNTAVGYFGKNSPNPGTPWYSNDYNNFGPAFGFAWQVPWFGEGKTTIRGGYQVTYQIGQAPNNIFQENAVPGSTNNITYSGDSVNTYLDMTKVPSLIPVPSALQPMVPVPVTDRTQQVYQPETGVTPYTQNLTLSVTRSLGANLTMDLRYVATLSRKQWNPVFNINVPDFLYNGLQQAFDAARSGGESPLLNQIFNGINIGAGTVGQNGFTGAAALRADSRFNSNLANGNYSAVAATLNTLNYTTALNPTLPIVPGGVNGAVLRVNGLPENFVVANPQFAAVNLITNDYSTNYHSLEAHIAVRPTHGLSFQSTYTYSKNLGTGIWAASGSTLGPTFTNPVNRHADYAIQPDTRVHDLRTNGTFALPIGPNKLFLGQTKGTLARIVENWQTGFIVNLNSGAPTTVTGNTSLYANGRPDIVGPFPVKGGKTTFTGTPAAFGSYYAPGSFTTVVDPQCAAIAPSLKTSGAGGSSLCTLNAIADAHTGQILLQNPRPGAVPTMGLGSIIGPGRWRFDANISKAIRLAESKSLQFRLDASDVFNHPEPNAPILNITGTNASSFGLIQGKSTLHRMLQAQLRFTF